MRAFLFTLFICACADVGADSSYRDLAESPAAWDPSSQLRISQLRPRSAMVSWDMPSVAAAGYRVVLNGKPRPMVFGTSSSLLHLKPGLKYHVVVEAVDSNDKALGQIEASMVTPVESCSRLVP